MTADEAAVLPEDQGADPEAAEAPPPPPSLPLQWAYLENSAEQDHGQAVCEVLDDRLHLKCKAGAAFDVPYAGIAAIEDRGAGLLLSMRDGSALELTKMARLKDMLCGAIMERWTKLNRRQALAEETLLERFSGKACHGNEPPRNAGIGVYATALVLDFGDGTVARVPFVFSGRPEEQDYRFVFTLPGEHWAVSHIGRDTDRFRAVVAGAMNKLEEAALARLQALCPAVPAMRARRLAALFLDGLAVPLKAARDAFPALEAALLSELTAAGLSESWQAVAALGDAGLARIGRKDSLRASGGPYRWFFVPVVRGDKAAVVMEASGEGSTGRATYVFRVPDGPSAVETAMDRLNYGLVMVNFRREPIYMSDAQMRKPENAHYMRSAERVPALAELRANYLGRVAHSNQEAWRSNLDALLNRL